MHKFFKTTLTILIIICLWLNFSAQTFCESLPEQGVPPCPEEYKDGLKP
jgi:hypothetical protein